MIPTAFGVMAMRAVDALSTFRVPAESWHTKSKHHDAVELMAQ